MAPPPGQTLADPQPKPQPERHLRLVTRQRRRRLTRVGWFCVSLVIGILFSLSLFHAFITDQQTTLDDLNVELSEVRVYNDKLRLEVARAEAPARIVAEAQYRLGMVEPDSRIYLTPVSAGESGAG